MKKILIFTIIMVISITAFNQSIFTVTKSTDVDPFEHPFNFDDNLCDPEMYGTLQWAINKANYNSDESIIEFDIPGEGLHEILLNSYLPRITTPTVIDATTQSGYDGTESTIIINGQHQWPHGIYVDNATVTIRGLHITNFFEWGITLRGSDNSKISDNKITKIMTNPTLVIRETPTMGLYLTGCNNAIIYNNYLDTKIDTMLPFQSAARYGIYIQNSNNCTIGGQSPELSNLISNCGNFGVLLNNSQEIKMSGNLIYDNDIALELINNSNNGIQPPIINEYTDEILSGTALPNSTIEVFGSTGEENANEYLVSTDADGNGDWSVEVSTENIGYVGIQTTQDNNTSNLSRFYAKNTCYQGIPLLYPSNSGQPVVDNFWVNDPNVQPDLRCCSGEDPCECDEGCFWITSDHGLDEIEQEYPEPRDVNVQIQCSICVNDDTPLYIHEVTQGLYDDIQHEWYYTSSGIEITSSGHDEIISFTASEAGIGTHTITCCGDCDDEGMILYACRTARITVYGPDATITPVSPFCINDSPVTLQAVTPGGTWSGEGIINASTGEFDPSAVNLPLVGPGHYTISYSVDIDGCSDEDEITITVNDIPNANVSDNEVCVGDATTMFTLSGISTSSESYFWSTPTVITSTSNIVNIDNAEINMEGIYTVTVTDIGTGCSSTASGNLTVHESPEVTFSEVSGICQNEAISITAFGGIDYEWSNESNDATTTISSGGTYIVTVYNENCNTIASIEVPESNLTIALIENISSCENDETGLLTVEATDGVPPYSYNWEGPESFSSTSSTISSLMTGTYNLTVVDYIGCTTSDGFDIVSTSAPNVTILIDDNYVCEDETILTASSATAELYEWSNGETNFWTQINSTDSYSVTVEDVHGCTNSDQIEVTFIPDPIINPSSNTYCEGEMTIQVYNPAGLSSYVEVVDEFGVIYWSNIVNSVGEINLSIPHIDAGSYTLNYHVNNGLEQLCPYSEDIIIYENPIAEITGGDSFVCESSTELTAFGGIIYQWNTSANSQSINVDVTDTYFVTVTNENGCTAEDDFFVEFADGIDEITTVFPNNNLCSGEVYFTVSPGGSFSANIFNEFGDEIINSHWFIDEPTQTLPLNENPIDPGIYTLYLISSVNGCEYTHDFIIPEACPEIDVTRIPGTCTYPYNGTVEVTISGGTPPYEVYLGQDGAIASEIYTFAQTGTYIIETNDDFNPNHAFSVILNDSDSYYTDVYVSSQPAMHFQWSPYNVYTTDNLTEELYQDMIICIGNANDQTLNISHDVTFNNCHIYTNTQGSDDTHYTIWKIFYDDQINMESGHLHIINGTTIESGCPDKMWQGIEARGEYNVNCETMLIDIVDSKISDAMHAIKLWGNVHLNADNSTFENNRIDINLNQWGWGIANFDHTYINNNIFQTTRSLNNSMVYPKAHVYLKWASDITFKNNEFINSTVMIPNEFGFDEYTVDKRGKGIEAVFSSFIVTPVSNQQYVAPMYNSENYFEGLFYAIDVRGQKNYAPKVYHSDFVNNFRGIHFRGTNGSRILFNEINTTNADVGFETNNLTLHNNPINGNVSYGVYIDRGLNTWFEENTIYNGKAGSYIFSTGNSGTRYYRNKFGDPNDQTMGMEAATIVVGRNSNWDASNPPTTNTGLEIRCNNYIANNTAISVLNGNMRKNQGVLGGNTDQLAGNQFHSSFTNGTEFKVQIHENIFGPPSQFSYLDLGVYNYYQHDDGASGTEQNGYHRRLLTYSDLEVDPQTQDDKRFYESEACESHYSLPVVHDPDVVIFDISFQTNTLETLENQYDEIIDRGDTEYMISVAEELDPHNFRQYTTILSNDGYLSDQVFLTLLDNHVAQKPVIAAILIANSPLPEDILDEVNNSTYLDNGHKNKILKYQEGTNPRLLLEYEMADVKQEIIYLESELVNNAINNDSIIGVKEIAINYFNSKPIQLVKDLQTIYNLSISSNDYTTAENSLSDLRIIANTLSEDEAIEVIRFCDVNQLYISALNDTANYSLLYDNREFLLEAARSTSPSYSVTAEILYSIVTDSSYFEYTPLPVNEMGSRSIQINNEITKDVVNNFDIYPNPVLNTLNIYFDLSATCEDGYEVLYETIGKKKQEGCSFGEILIYTSDAKLIETIPLESITGTLSIDIESYKPGVYLIEIDNCYGDKRTKKITKTQ